MLTDGTSFFPGMYEFQRVQRAFSHQSGLASLKEIRRGIEKESLRVTPDGSLARTPHPKSIGSALTHPRITTDFAESQVEFISGVHRDVDACFEELLDLHAFVYQKLEGELLWTSSMPCVIGAEEEIPLADYGQSNEGRLRHLYRMSLALRYGAKMQTVSGIHYNFSLPAELLSETFGTPTQAYMHLIRNLNRFAWLLILLFGASPALCYTFLSEGVRHKLKHWDAGTLYRRHATSLRMGPLGYTGKSQRNLYITCNSLDGYIEGLRSAMRAPYTPFNSLGLYQGKTRQQMSTNLLQFEAEYYGVVRPKRTPAPGQRALEALMQGGVEYIELRCNDLNPFEPIGMDAQQVRFLDCLFVSCLMLESGDDSPAQAQENRRNQWKVVRSGRSPRLKLKSRGEEQDAKTWALELLEACRSAAELLDRANGGADYASAVELQIAKIEDPGLTPSARILSELAKSKQSFFRYSMDLSLAIQSKMLDRQLSTHQWQALEAEVNQSLEDAAMREDQPQADFDEYVDAWLARV